MKQEPNDEYRLVPFPRAPSNDEDDDAQLEQVLKAVVESLFIPVQKVALEPRSRPCSSVLSELSAPVWRLAVLL